MKKYYKPIRKIEFIEKSKLGILRRKSIGIIDISKWEKDIEPITKYLIRNDYKRRKWKFGWSIGDFFMIISILFGISETIATTYIDGFNLNLSQPTSELGKVILNENKKMKQKSNEAEEKYMKNNEK